MPQLQPVSVPDAPEGSHYSVAEVQAMQRAVIKLFERWGLSDEQAVVLLGNIATRTYQRWKVGSYGRAGVDLSARLSNLLGIHKALRLLFKDARRGYGWLRRGNAAFGGKSALDIMLGGQLTDLMRVRRYLDAQRAPW
ncbi:MAG: MbcA/ParS/Xre antitoxin family protein [Aestuariivirgaceae bacterium]